MVVKPGYFGSPKGFQELSRGFSPANFENVEALFFLLSGLLLSGLLAKLEK
jgi:hypothetical protein